MFETTEQIQHVYTVQEVLDRFSSEFMQKTIIMAFAFLFVMLYLEYYTTSMQKEYKKLGRARTQKEKILCYISDIFFLASIAYALTMISYLTGWF